MSDYVMYVEQESSGGCYGAIVLSARSDQEAIAASLAEAQEFMEIEARGDGEDLVVRVVRDVPGERSRSTGT